MANQQADRKSEPITGAKIALIGTIGAAIIGAIATIIAALLSHRGSGPVVTTVVVPPPPPATRDVFDKAALEGTDGVKKILIGTYGIRADEIHNLDCPANQEVKAGNKFTCTVTIGRAEQVVDIAVLDDNGQYQVGQPHDM